MRTTRAVALLVVVALAATACGGGSSKLERHTAPGTSLSLETPGGWKSVSAQDVVKAGFIANLRKESPVLADAVAPLGQPNSAAKLLILDPHVKQGFASNVNVVKETIPTGMNLAKYGSATDEQIRAAGLTKTIERTPVTLPAGPAVRLRYSIDIPDSKGGRIQTATDQYLFVRGDKGYVVTYTTIPSLRAQYAPVFATSAQSIQLP